MLRVHGMPKTASGSKIQNWFYLVKLERSLYDLPLDYVLLEDTYAYLTHTRRTSQTEPREHVRLHPPSHHCLALFFALASAVNFNALGASSFGMNISTNWILSALANSLSLKRSSASCFVLTW